MAKLGVEQHESFATFRLWAPFAQKVAVGGDFSDWQNIPLTKNETTGVWEAIIKRVKPGNSYKYEILGFDNLLHYKNDPRAKVLTDSDVGRSVVADDEFNWEGCEKTPVVSRSKQIIYELHIGTFVRPDAATSGTFTTAIEKLDYLKELGVTTIELMPITSMATSNGWGYAPNALYSVEPLYGGMFGLKTFVKEAHKRGLQVILDMVYNHFSGSTDLWQFDGWSKDNHGGIYFYNDSRGDTPWGGRPDYGRPEVRDFILDNVAMWLSDYRDVGFRIDSTIYMRNTAGLNDDPAHDIGDAWDLLSEITALAHKINPEALMIAEDCAGNSMITAARENNGCGFDSQWDLGLPHVIRGALGIPGEGPGLQNISNVLQQNFNNDWTKRIVFADSHDTAANGNTRIVSAASQNTHSTNSRKIAILSSAIALTAPGIPMILAGSEFLQGGDFNDWNALAWENTDKFKGIIEAHKHLIALRQNQHGNTGGLMSGEIKILSVDEKNKVLVYQRGSDDEAVIIATSFNPSEVIDYQLPIPDGQWNIGFDSSWRGYSPDFKELNIEKINNQTKISLPAYIILIITKN